MPRNPKPTALKMLHGDRKDRMPKGEPVPAAGKVERPDWIEGWAQQTWDRLAPDLAAKKVLTGWDVELFARYCWLEGATREQMIELDVEGLMLGKVKNPRCQVLRDMMSEMRAIGSHFGLTPVDRVKLAAPKEPNDEKGAGRLLA